MKNRIVIGLVLGLIIASTSFAAVDTQMLVQVDARMKEGTKFHNENKANKAISVYESIIKDYPTASEDILFLAKLSIGKCMAITNFSSSFNYVENLIQTSPTTNKSLMANAKLHMGRCLDSTGRLGEAKEIYDDILVKYSADTNIIVEYVYEAKRQICVLLVTQKKYADAEISFRNVLKEYPQGTPFYVNVSKLLGSCLLKQEKYSDDLKLIFEPTYKVVGLVDEFKACIKTISPKALKKKMFADKRSFTGEEGKKYMDDTLGALVVAMNDPMMNGIEKALLDIGINIPEQNRTDFSTFASNVLVQVNNIDADPSDDKVTGVLSLYMGVDAWNSFVKTYNGEK